MEVGPSGLGPCLQCNLDLRSFFFFAKRAHTHCPVCGARPPREPEARGLRGDEQALMLHRQQPRHTYAVVGGLAAAGGTGDSTLPAMTRPFLKASRRRRNNVGRKEERKTSSNSSSVGPLTSRQIKDDSPRAHADRRLTLQPEDLPAHLSSAHKMCACVPALPFSEEPIRVGVDFAGSA